MKSTTAENKIAPPASAYQTGVVKVFTFLGFMTLIARAQWGGGGGTTKNKNATNATRYWHRRELLTVISSLLVVGSSRLRS